MANEDESISDAVSLKKRILVQMWSESAREAFIHFSRLAVERARQAHSTDDVSILNAFLNGVRIFGEVAIADKGLELHFSVEHQLSLFDDD
jgi:hypothetical protein